MSKSKNDSLTYIIATAKPTEQLDGINRLGGQIYSKTVSLALKTYRQKGFWLSDGGLKAYLKFKRFPCQAHSVQAIIDDYCGARRSYFTNAKTNPNAKPPHETRKFHTFTWRATGISYQRGKLRLSMGKGRDPLWIKIDKKFYKKVPAEVSLVYNRTTKQYEFHATYVGLVPLISFIDISSDIDERDEWGKTLLQKAAKNNNYDLAKILLALGANPNIRDRFGTAPLYSAWLGNAIEVFSLLLSHGADPNVNSLYGDLGRPPMLWGGSEFTATLLAYGADPNTQDASGETALHMKARWADDPEDVLLLLKHGADPNVKDKVGNTPLVKTKRTGTDIAKVLLEHGADPDATDYFGDTRLRAAVVVNDVDFVALLLSHGADPNIKDKAGQTTLHAAVIRNSIDVATLLLSHGVVDPNADDCFNQTPLHFAVGRRVATVLLEYGADVNAKDCWGQTALPAAVIENDADLVTLLLAYGADPNIKDCFDRTPLHFAVGRRVATVLLEYGADVNAKDADGFTPLTVAVKENAIEVVEVLRQQNARA